MFKILFLLFLIVPIVEISILIQLSEVIGGWTTILLVVITAYLGAKMVKQQGLATVAQIQQKAATGHIPGMELFSGVCILISGVLLLTPGIMTDIIGFLLLTPIVRTRMAEVLKEKIHIFGANQANQTNGAGQNPFAGGSPFSFTSYSEYQGEHHEQHQEPSNSSGEEFISGDRYRQSPQQSEDGQQPSSVIEGEFRRKE